MERRTYNLTITVNGRLILEVVIDPHYEEKHSDIDDALILELVKKLDGKEFKPEERDGDWEFFMVDDLDYESKKYRLVWCMREHAIFIGVINAFRR